MTLTASTFTVATTWSYGLAFAGYAVFATRVAIGSLSNARARVLFAALAVTAVWAASCASVALAPGPQSALAVSVFDALRLGAWYLFLWHLLAVPRTPHGMSRATRLQFALVVTALVASFALAESSTWVDMLGTSAARTIFLLRLGLAVYGLILVEQVVRRVPPQMRWAIKPLVIALSGVFGLELFLYADGVLFGQLDADIWASRGFANLLVIPLLAMASARNSEWTVDLHLSRDAVFHTGALLVSGTFLLAVAIAGYFVRYFGGEWGQALQIELLFAAALFIALVAWSGQFRSRLKVFVSKHFFSYRYDYRQEWLRFTHTLSSESAVQGLQERVVMALADLVESPGGVLWMKEDARGFTVSARWNVSRVDGVERADSPLVRFLERTGWIVDIAEFREHRERYDDVDAPDWLAQVASPWLIVPLLSGSELQSFVVLAKPRAEVDVDWEVRDLLKTASRQAASYLGQVRATEALLEARKFDAFNRMSAFVVHDLKNLVAQLSLMLRNARRHHDNPAFQADMLATVENVVSRMNALMLQLRTGAAPVDKPHPVDLSAIVRNVCSGKSSARTELVFEAAGPLPAMGHEDRLEHVIGHLIQNAIDATEPPGRVVIRTTKDGEYATVLVADDGVGMSEAFVRERLFKPFETTKPSGMGIGVYESSQYVTSLGGDISVDSSPGAGTLVRVRLPAAAMPEREDSQTAEIKEQAA